jgi:hypothetical protein
MKHEIEWLPWQRRLAMACLSTFFAGFLSCGGYDSAKFDPYKGSLPELLPKQVSQFTLEQSDSNLEKIQQERLRLARESETGLHAIDETRANYKDPVSGKLITLSITNYLSRNEANTMLQRIADQNKLFIDEKKIKGKVVGKRLEAPDTTGFGYQRMIRWTNGSLLCSVSIIGNDALDVASIAQKFESQVPF